MTERSCPSNADLDRFFFLSLSNGGTEQYRFVFRTREECIPMHLVVLSKIHIVPTALLMRLMTLRHDQGSVYSEMPNSRVRNSVLAINNDYSMIYRKLLFVDNLTNVKMSKEQQGVDAGMC